MDFEQGFFDSTVDAHGDRRLMDPMRLRGYINFRLLFWPQVYFTDATINNNMILRDLMFEDRDQDRLQYKYYPKLPRDYHNLFEKRIIKVAVRSDLDAANFSSQLRERQRENQNLSLPDENYVRRIDQLLDSNAVIIYEIDEVSRLFSEKVKNYLQLEARESGFPERKNVCTNLYSEYRDVERLNFNELLDSVKRSGYHEETDIYKDLKDSISQCYNNNVPESLKLNNQEFMLSDKFMIDRRENQIIVNHPLNETIPVRFDIQSLAYLPSEQLSEILNLTERQSFMNQLDLYANQREINYNDLCSTLSTYSEAISNLIGEYYKTINTHHGILTTGLQRTGKLAMRIAEHPMTPIISYTLGRLTEGAGIIPAEMMDAISEVRELFGIFITPWLKSIQFQSRDDKLFKILKNRSVITVG